MFPSFVSDLWCKVGGIGALPLGEKPLSIPHLELFTCGCALLCHLSHCYTVVGTAFGLTLTVGMPAIGPGVSEALFSPGHQRRYTCSNHGSGPAVGTMEAAQTLAWPNPCMYLPTKSTVAKARPISATGAFIVHSDVL